MLDDAIPMLIQCRAYFLRCGVSNIPPDHNDKVTCRQAVLRLAKAFSKLALEPVSPGCPGHLLARDGEAEARTLALFTSYQDRNQGIGTAKIVLENLLKFVGTRQSKPSRERFPGSRSHATASDALCL